MRKLFLFPALVASLAMFSCIGEEPLNAECDIEKASVLVDNPEAIFYHDYDSVQMVFSSVDSIGFFVRPGVDVSAMPLFLKVTPGATIYHVEDGHEVLFRNGSSLDFSGDVAHIFRIYSEDKVWNRTYKVCVVHDVDPSFGHKFYHFNFDGNYSLFLQDKTIDDKGNYFVWKEIDEDNVADLFGSESWKCGNPGFKKSVSRATAMMYPTVPLKGEGPDGSDCVKLETMDTEGFGAMVNMRIASGSLFTGYFDVDNALKDALKATQFGLPFKHKPVRFKVWLKCSIGPKFQDKKGKPEADAMDEPDAYLVVYRNQDEDGKKVLLDGNDVLTSKYIVGMARLPHNYYYEEVDGRTVRRDLVGTSPIHGVTSEWQQFDMPVEYTEEIDQDVLAANGYSMIIGFSSSWQGAYFRGAIGTKLWLDNIEVECEY